MFGRSRGGEQRIATPEADQASALFGSFAIGLTGYVGVA